MSEAPAPAAEAIATAVRDCALERYPLLRDSVAALARAVIRLREADDFLAIIHCANALSLAAEAAAQAAEMLHARADAGLLQGLLDSGAPALHCGAHTLGTRQNPDHVEILDQRSVPEAFLVPADPRLDLAAVRRHLRDHPETNWGRLTPGSVSLVRKAVS